MSIFQVAPLTKFHLTLFLPGPKIQIIQWPTGMEKIYIPGSHPANSIVLQALILLSQCNPMAHGWTIYLSWLQTRNELQSDGFGAKPPKAEQAWPRRTNKILNYSISQLSNINSFGCKMWKKILRNNQHFFSVYIQNF